MTTTVLSPNRHTGRVSPIRLAIVHTTESNEIAAGAEGNANYFAKPTTRASAHVVVDNDSEVRCVPDSDTAWAAPGANADGLQLEIVARAGQGAAGWDDAYSRAALERAAQVMATWCRTHDIPVRRLTVDQVRDGKSRGIAGHVDVTAAFKKSTHWDPGPTFPWDAFLARVFVLVGGGAPAPAPVAPSAPPADTRPRNGDGSLTIAADGVRGGATNARWQEVMGTPIDGTISKPSLLIEADQHFLNSVVDHGHIRNLTGKDTLKPDGYEGKLTVVVRQFWLFNTIGPRILGRGPLMSDFDGIAGARTNTLHQHALNAATARTGRY